MDTILQQLYPLQWHVPLPTVLATSSTVSIHPAVLPKREAALAAWPKKSGVTDGQSTPLVTYAAFLLLLKEQYPAMAFELCHVLHAIAYIEDNVSSKTLQEQAAHAFSCARALHHAVQSGGSLIPFGHEEVSLKLTHAHVLALFCDQKDSPLPAVYTLAASLWDKSLLSYNNDLVSLYGQVSAAFWRANALSQLSEAIIIDGVTVRGDDIPKRQHQKSVYASAANDAIRAPFVKLVAWNDSNRDIATLTRQLQRVSERFNNLSEEAASTLVTYQNKGGYYLPGDIGLSSFAGFVPALPETLAIATPSVTEGECHGLFDKQFISELAQARISYAGQSIVEKVDTSHRVEPSLINVVARLLGQSDATLLEEMKTFPNLSSTVWQQGLIVGVLVERLGRCHSAAYDLDILRDASKLQLVLKQLCPPTVNGQFSNV